MWEWITSNNFFSCGVSLRAKISIGSSSLYWKLWPCYKVFLVTLFLPLLLKYSVETVLICWHTWLPGLHWLLSVLCSSECQNYQSLTSADRKTNYANNNKCDNKLSPGWFRFQGAAGTRMPTSCPPINRCNTQAPGWLNGGHPTVADGQVTRQVCYHWSSSCCQWPDNIQVRNCGSFYVYYLSPPSAGCNLRFCTD